MPPQNNTTNNKLLPPANSVTIRMYNTGFGDCFLLTFRDKDDQPFYMLIDFGVHHQYKPDRVARVEKVAQNIMDVTNGHLNIVAVTHEHTDHLYGFKYAREILKGIEIDELWLAWTEDPTDSDALELKRLYGKETQALRIAINFLAKRGDPLASRLQAFPDFEFDHALSAASGGNRAQLDFLRLKSKKKLVKSDDYRHPQEAPLTLPNVGGIKCYVLGPPKEVKWIRSLVRKNELYPEMALLSPEDYFIMAALAFDDDIQLDEDDEKVFDNSLPFDSSLKIDPETLDPDTPIGTFFRKSYGTSNKKGHGEKWRRIDTNWLQSSKRLALKIDSKTNNTSLVLAFELTQANPRKVLLFVGDAQVGNWLSWQQMRWENEGAGGAPVTAPDLLSRTVLYKVGHHGSHNATLMGKGLEQMDSPELVAMIPVDEHWANTDMHWEHPAEKLYKRLEQKTKGRIIRTDQIPTGNALPNKPIQTTDSEWDVYCQNLDWDKTDDKLWIQYTIPI